MVTLYLFFDAGFMQQRLNCLANGNVHVEELNFLSAEPISDLRQQLKRKRHGRDDDDLDEAEEDEGDTTSERSGASGDGDGGGNDLEAAVVAATAKADTTPPG